MTHLDEALSDVEIVEIESIVTCVDIRIRHVCLLDSVTCMVIVAVGSVTATGTGRTGHEVSDLRLDLGIHHPVELADPLTVKRDILLLDLDDCASGCSPGWRPLHFDLPIDTNRSAIAIMQSAIPIPSLS